MLHRRDDRAVPFHLGRALASLVPGARFLPLHGSDHAPWMGRPGPVLEATLAFLGDDARAVADDRRPRPT